MDSKGWNEISAYSCPLGLWGAKYYNLNVDALFAVAVQPIKHLESLGITLVIMHHVSTAVSFNSCLHQRLLTSSLVSESREINSHPDKSLKPSKSICCLKKKKKRFIWPYKSLSACFLIPLSTNRNIYVINLKLCQSKLYNNPTKLHY